MLDSKEIIRSMVEATECRTRMDMIKNEQTKINSSLAINHNLNNEQTYEK